jgi:tyrosyl-tRNA synthetase
MNLYDELSWRGLIYDATEGVKDVLSRDRVTVYIGFDPTAPSLHVGSLLQMIALAHVQRRGHIPVAVVGGGTGLIGDPSGKTAERQLLTPEKVDENVAGIRAQLARVLDFDRPTNAAVLVNNADWLTKLGAIDFMRDVGKHFSVSAMLARESVKRRIESEEGISYTEFSYALLQAYDYLELYRRLGCTLQMGGSDQWGNITAGMDLIRRVEGVKAHGLVLPLIMTASGTKFGKTEKGTIWLDPELTSPYQFYQFWLNVDDRDVGRYLRFFTFLDQPRIQALEAQQQAAPEKRHAHRELARVVTTLVHGEEHAASAEAAAAKLFSESTSGLTLKELEQAFADVPTTTVALRPEGWSLVSLLVDAGVAASRSKALQLIRGGGIYVNDRRISDEKEQLRVDQAVEGEVFVVRKGKRDYFLIRIARG